ncbi:MAG: hypothetical protein IJV31_06535 [Clostridia bacterium]|nr:hypothetical protein [Clostridia bacterium]MBR1718070.1 hypothetical protein [Bacilli bacterium]
MENIKDLLMDCCCGTTSKECTCNSDKNCNKEELIKAIEEHVNTSKAIRECAWGYVQTLPLEGVDMDILHKFIMTSKFDDFNAFIRMLPKYKAVKDLQKGEMFVNPDGGEKLQAWSLKEHEDGTCTVKALHYDNELSKYLFDSDRMVIIAE